MGDLMEECELCGRASKDIYVVDVENVELRACASCAKGKHVIRIEGDQKPAQQKAKFSRPKPLKDEDMELVDDFAGAIRRAREGMKIPIKVLAEMLNEKEHLLLRIEENKTRPTIALTKKLEKALKIKLTQAPIEETGQFKGGGKRAAEPTIGDFIEEK